MRSQLNIPEDAFVILQVATLSSEKRQEDALVALKYLLHKYPTINFQLAFVGHGTKDREMRLKHIAKKLGISDNVIFFGIQSDITQFYIIGDIFTLTSAKVEAFSVAALEAMSMGLPCILTDIGGAREMIVEGMNGYLVQPHNPRHIAYGWLAAFENKEHFDHEKIRARVIKHFSLSDCIHNYERLLAG